MTGLRYSPLHATELCGEMQGKFIVGRARLITILLVVTFHPEGEETSHYSGCLSYSTCSVANF